MAKSKKQVYQGVVYSTDSNFEYIQEEDALVNTLAPAKQSLRIALDKKARKGKAVTLITGFVGTDEDLASLAKHLKQRCAVGGSSKDGEIVLQGDFRQRVGEILKGEGYRVKILG
jgi:translation initiation factor 1